MTSKRHVKLPGSQRGQNPAAFRVGDVNPEEKVVAKIRLSGPDLPGPDEFVGQTMTSREVEKKFGASQPDADKVKKCLEKFNLSVGKPLLLTRSMPVSGTAKAMYAAFKPKWAMMRSPTYGLYRGRQGKIQIPPELEGIVTGVFGLDKSRMAHRRAGTKVSARPGSALKPFTPKTIEDHYNFPAGNGEGQSIAIAEFGGGYFVEDLKKYCKNFNRSEPEVKKIKVGDGRAYKLKELPDIPNPELRHLKLDESFEVMMDVEIIAGLCPKASISVYFSTFDQSGWIDLLDKVITAKPIPVALSISWGRAEDDWWTDDAINAINDRLNLARLLGITICVASGDDGWRDEVNEQFPLAHVDFPASSPHVLGVGGTMFKRSGANFKEVTWVENPGDANMRGSATGGGVSRRFPRPAWQDVDVAPLLVKGDGRVVPDVAALAGEPYYDLFFAGVPWPDGKTSASAPLWAALIARINAQLPPNKRQRFLTPLLYQKLENGKTVGEVSCTDITLGKNTSQGPGSLGYYARQGFDAATGWGVPDGVELLKYLAEI
jgi:kumamolisin